MSFIESGERRALREFISGGDEADAVLLVGRTEDQKGTLRPSRAPARRREGRAGAGAASHSPQPRSGGYGQVEPLV